MLDQGAGQRLCPFGERDRLPGQHDAAHRPADLGSRSAILHAEGHLHVTELHGDLGDHAGLAAHSFGHRLLPLNLDAVRRQRLPQRLGQHPRVYRDVRAVGAERGGNHVQRKRVIVLSHVASSTGSRMP
jgi:hypothetical protein